MRTRITMTEDEVREACVAWLNEHAVSAGSVDVECIRLDIVERAASCTNINELEINAVAEWEQQRGD